MNTKTSYIIRYHTFLVTRIADLEQHLEKLYRTLSPEEFVQHPLIKLVKRLRHAIKNEIPQNPNDPDFLLKGSLGKFRRYKRGLQRYRLIFCFSSEPPIIVYLYVNDLKHLRKDGSKNDPYEEFLSLYKKGLFSHDPIDPQMQKWIANKF